MVFSPRHYGLYITEAHVKAARDQRDKPPFTAAWKLLREHEETGVQAALWCGLRFRFEDDDSSGEQSVQRLLDFVESGLDPNMTYVDALTETLSEAHAFELVREHGALAAGLAAAAQAPFAGHVRYAIRVAGLATERPGAAAAMPSRAQVLERFGS